MSLRPNQRYFNTQEAAERHLEFRKKAAYRRIEKKGWKVVGDNSFVHQNDFFYCEHMPWTHKHKGKWFAVLSIITDEFVKDLMNYKPIDVEAELEAVLEETKKIDKNILREITKLALDKSDKEKNQSLSGFF